MTIGACSAYVDLRHVVRTWTAMLSPCLYFVPCMRSFACSTRRWRRREEYVCRTMYPVPIELTRTSIKA